MRGSISSRLSVRVRTRFDMLVISLQSACTLDSCTTFSLFHTVVLRTAPKHGEQKSSFSRSEIVSFHCCKEDSNAVETANEICDVNGDNGISLNTIRK